MKKILSGVVQMLAVVFIVGWTYLLLHYLSHAPTEDVTTILFLMGD